MVTKNSAGWWYVDMEGQEGWVPSSYLERKLSTPVSPSHAMKSPTSPSVSVPHKKPTVDPPRESNREPVKEKRKEPPPKKEPKKEPFKEPRKEPMKREQTKEPKREPPWKERKPEQAKKDLQQRNDTSPLGARKFSLSSKSSNFVDGEQRPSLRRSTSTDSGLYDEVGIKKKETNPLHSPPPVRVTPAPPRPKRPINIPTLPNTKLAMGGAKSPKVDRVKLKATISGPLPFQPSPTSKRKTDALGVSKTMKPTSRPANSNDSSRVSMSGTRPGASRPAVKRGDSNEHVNTLSATRDNSSNHVGKPRHVKKNSSPEIKFGRSQETGNRMKKNSDPELRLGGLHETDGNSANGRRGTADLLASSRPKPHTRRGSADTTVGNAYKQELAKKLSEKSGPPQLQQPPKRPSPPNRPKAPTMRSTSSGTKLKAPPSRPLPPKVTPAKRPPPPRPSVSPMSKKLSCVTIGAYTGGDPASCLTFRDGESVEVLEKNNDGWWFVKIGEREGWAPSTYIEEKPQKPVAIDGSGSGHPHLPRPRPPPPSVSNPEPEKDTSSDPMPKPKPRPRPRKFTTSAFYRAVDSYDVPVYEDAGLPLMQGRVYELKEKSDEGWWLMKDGDLEGWAPSSYFKLV